MLGKEFTENSCDVNFFRLKNKIMLGEIMLDEVMLGEDYVYSKNDKSHPFEMRKYRPKQYFATI